jgi:hypothetical protein
MQIEKKITQMPKKSLQINNHQIKNLRIICIENFSMSKIQKLKKLNAMNFFIFTICSPIHIEIFKLSHDFFHHSHV